MMYDSGILTRRGQVVQDDFEKLEGATDTADMLHRYHHPYLGGPRQMLHSANGNKVLALVHAFPELAEVKH